MMRSAIGQHDLFTKQHMLPGGHLIVCYLFVIYVKNVNKDFPFN
jgi:hypothetical protein